MNGATPTGLLIVLASLSIILIAGCSDDQTTATPELRKEPTPLVPTVELPTPTPTPAPTGTPTPTQTAAPTPTRTPPPTPPRADRDESPSEIPTNSPTGSASSQDIEQEFECETSADANGSSSQGSSDWYVFPRANHVAVLLGDDRVAFAGGTSVSGHDLWPNHWIDHYDPRTETWCSTRRVEGYPKYASTVALKDGRFLIVGIAQTTSNEDVNPVGLLFDLVTGRSSEISPPSVSRKRPKLALLDDGRVLSLGGLRVPEVEDGPAPTYLADVEIYDPVANAWTRARSLQEMLAKPRNQGVVAAYQLFDPQNYWLLPMWNSRALLFHSGYDDNSIARNRIEVYDANNDSWNTIEEFAPGGGAPAWNMTLTPQGKLYMFYRHRVEILDITSGEWELNYSPRRLPVGASVTELQDGRLLLAGGKLPHGGYSTNTTARVEIFDPKTQIWTAGPELPESRAHHTATLLQNGDVLLYGGNLLTSLTLPSIYPPETMARLISAQDLEKIATDASVTPDPLPFGYTDFPCRHLASPPPPLPVVPNVPDSAPGPRELISDANEAMKALESVAATLTIWVYGGERQENLMLTYQSGCLPAYVEWETPDRFLVRHTLWGGRGPNSTASDIVLGDDIHSLFYWDEEGGRPSDDYPEFLAGYLRSALADQKLVDIDWDEWISLSIERDNPFIQWKDVTIETLDGTDVYHLIGALDRSDGATATTSFWIGVEDSLIRRIYSQGSVPDKYSPSGIRQVTELWAFNRFGEDFNIQPPPDDDIADEDG